MRLNIACGPNVFPSENWINYDREDISGYINDLKKIRTLQGLPEHQHKLAKYINEGGKIDFHVRDLRNGFPEHGNGSIDAIYLGQMIEHVNPLYEAQHLLMECRRMLKPGGVLKITTPDLDLLINAYKNDDMGRFACDQPAFYKDAHPSAQLAYLMYGSSGQHCTWDNYEGHMFLYTKASISVLLSKAGFPPPFTFYNEGGMSLDQVMALEAVDAGMSHSFAVEAVAP
jgi:SAM-dependent methyltransferase